MNDEASNPPFNPPPDSRGPGRPPEGQGTGVGAKPPISINHRHEGIIKWLIANPHRTLGECAAELGYTQAWLSTVIHSDAFQCKLREVQDESYSIVCLSLKDKLTALSHLTLDKLIQTVPVMTDPNQLLDTADLTLKSLGYSSPRAPAAQPITINNYTVPRDVLAQAREIAMGKAPLTQEKEADDAIPALPAP